jgi:hypothetical protein
MEAAEGMSGPADRLAQALAEAPWPAWRKAYLSNLIVSGRRFAAAGNARGAEYCFAKVDEALQALPPAPSAAPETAPGAAAAPAEKVRRQWRQDRIEHAARVLDSHGARLSPLEKRTYRERLEKLREDSSQPSQARQADAGLLDLRRRLYQRVLKAQKATLLRKRSPAGARPSPPARVSATPAAWQPVTGPYNDRSNLEELLAVIGAADPAWVEEFLELYGNLAGLAALVSPPSEARK